MTDSVDLDKTPPVVSYVGLYCWLRTVLPQRYGLYGEHCHGIKYHFSGDFVCSLFPKAILFEFYFTLQWLL